MEMVSTFFFSFNKRHSLEMWDAKDGKYLEDS